MARELAIDPTHGDSRLGNFSHPRSRCPLGGGTRWPPAPAAARTFGTFPRMLLAAIALVVGCSVGWAPPVGTLAWGQDEPLWDRIEFRSSATDGVRTLSGIVRDIQPGFVEMEVPSGGRRRINQADVLAMHLLRQKELVAAENWASRGEFERAKQAFEGVVKLDVPRWLRRHAATRRLQCLRALQQYRAAVADFGALVQDDPTRIPWEAAPIVWTGLTVDALLQEQIEQWLRSPRAWEQLAAASLGLQHPPTAAASQKVLAALAASNESTSPPANPTELGAAGGSQAKPARAGGDAGQSPIALLAEAQLWRVPQRYTVEQLQTLQAKVDSWPPELRAGPLYLLGRAWKNAGQLNLSTDAMLQVATLYPEQHDLVLLGLEAAYTNLRSVEMTEAQRVGQWLVQRHPDSGQAREIRGELGQ